MRTGTEELLDFHSVVSRNALAFALSRRWAFDAMAKVVHSIDEISTLVTTTFDPNRKTVVSLAMPLSVFRRQVLVAFEMFASFRCHQAWLLFRPGLEAMLIGGKWLDDKSTVQVWKRRREDPDTYRKTFSGKSLRSKCLPSSTQIQDALKFLNDAFLHSNAEYCERHASLTAVNDDNLHYRLEYFDTEIVTDVHLLAFFNLSRVVIESFNQAVETRLSASHREISVSVLATELRPRVDAIAKQDDRAVQTLRSIGLWEIGSA
jgi:hypothetical protein